MSVDHRKVLAGFWHELATESPVYREIKELSKRIRLAGANIPSLDEVFTDLVQAIPSGNTTRRHLYIQDFQPAIGAESLECDASKLVPSAECIECKQPCHPCILCCTRHDSPQNLFVWWYHQKRCVYASPWILSYLVFVHSLFRMLNSNHETGVQFKARMHEINDRLVDVRSEVNAYYLLIVSQVYQCVMMHGHDNSVVEKDVVFPCVIDHLSVRTPAAERIMRSCMTKMFVLCVRFDLTVKMFHASKQWNHKRAAEPVEPAHRKVKKRRIGSTNLPLDGDEFLATLLIIVDSRPDQSTKFQPEKTEALKFPHSFCSGHLQITKQACDG